MSVIYGGLADTLVALHLAFVAFATLGGLLVLRWPRLAWGHIPVVVWAVAVEWLNLICPLTPLEQHLRALAGRAAYEGGFIEHYVLPLLYPSSLTRSLQITLGALVVVINVAVYARLWYLRYR